MPKAFSIQISRNFLTVLYVLWFNMLNTLYLFYMKIKKKGWLKGKSVFIFNWSSNGESWVVVVP